MRLATLVMLLTLAFTCKFALPQQSNSLVTIAFAEENVSGDPSEPGETSEAEDKQEVVPEEETSDDAVTAGNIPDEKVEQPVQSTTFTVRHWIVNADGSVSLYSETTLAGTVGGTATAAAMQIDGFAFDDAHEGSCTSAKIGAEGSTTLDLYYVALGDDLNNSEPKTNDEPEQKEIGRASCRERVSSPV